MSVLLLLNKQAQSFKEFVWSEIIERHDGKEIRQLSYLVDALFDLVISRENDLDAVIKKINSVHIPAED